jgi:hypothetical protein
VKKRRAESVEEEKVKRVKERSQCLCCLEILVTGACKQAMPRWLSVLERCDESEQWSINSYNILAGKRSKEGSPVSNILEVTPFAADSDVLGYLLYSEY